MVMTQNFKWNEQRISAYLQGEGDIVPVAKIPGYLSQGYQQLEAELPQDIRDIYLVPELANSNVAVTAEVLESV
jgi:hypothetical protein